MKNHSYNNTADNHACLLICSFDSVYMQINLISSSLDVQMMFFNETIAGFFFFSLSQTQTIFSLKKKNSFYLLAKSDPLGPHSLIVFLQNGSEIILVHDNKVLKRERCFCNTGSQQPQDILNPIASRGFYNSLISMQFSCHLTEGDILS